MKLLDNEKGTQAGLAGADGGTPLANISRMTWFQAFRGDFGYSHYGDHRTSVTTDIPFAAITYTCILISVAAIIAAAGIRGKERWYTLIRLTYSLAVGSIILVSVFGYCWQLGDVGVHSPYIYRSFGYIEARVGVRIGLKTANLTLIGTFKADGSSFKYNEELDLDEVLSSPQQLWSALERGLPQPLLSLIERFDTDEGEIRFGRASWMAGYFAHILLWTAFAFWVTSNILLCSVIWYGAAMFSLTGACMVLAVVAYHVLCAQTAITLPCSDGPLILKYNWCFWSVLVFGILTTLIGLILFALDYKVPKKLAEFFLLDNSLDEGEDYKQMSIYSASTSRLGTPDSIRKQFRSERRKSSSTALQWNVNYGFDCHTTNINPVYSKENSAASHERVDCQSPRFFNNIQEEEYQQSSSGEPSPNVIFQHKETNCTKGKSGDQNHETLTETYVDVTPNPWICEQKQAVCESFHIQDMGTMVNVYQL